MFVPQGLCRTYEKSISPPGTRVEVISLCNEEEHLKPGMKGTVIAVDDQPALLVNWDKRQQPFPSYWERPLPVVVPQQEGIPGHGNAVKKTDKRKNGGDLSNLLFHGSAGKQALFPTIIKRFPTGYQNIGLCGSVRGAGVPFLLNKERSVREVLNDANGNPD